MYMYERIEREGWKEKEREYRREIEIERREREVGFVLSFK